MESTIKTQPVPSWFDPYAPVRCDVYVLLAALLGRPPSEELIKIMQSLDWSEVLPEGLDQALQVLSQAGHRYLLTALEEEYDQLFVGLGRGEMMPYASWYKGKKIQSLPLVAVRSDLFRLGIVRQSEFCEPEDHAAALCEVMALISRKTMEVPLETQADFFQKHLSWWLSDLFEDLRAAKKAEFYREVGSFGKCFVESEKEFLDVK
ncbi:MAG: molecular chaperone TorD family protein [Deltaproteobacteria bacterium]|nr:molecular chaperone TorD family protein [Deltaproteobacteria bacterium]